MFYNMISSYYLFKLLKKKNVKDCKKKPPENFLISSQQMCRICLKLGTVPIYGNNSTQDISVAVCKFGDIEINENDDNPKHLCDSCFELLKSAIQFRQKAQESDIILRKLVKRKNNRDSSHTNSYSNSLPSSSKNASELQDQLNKIKIGPHANTDSLEFDEDHLSPLSPSLSENFSYVCSEYSDDNENNEIEYMPQRISKVRCKICKKVMLKGSAKNHLDIHSQTRKYVCEICGKSYSQKSAYYTHSFTHSTDFAFKCKTCPYRSNTAANLKSHMRTHIRDYKYVCTECPNRFLTKSNLNKHLLTHKGRSFKCNDCEKAYYNRRQLQIHIEVVHMGIKNHTCELCGRVFGYRKRMLDHQLRVHKRKRMRYGRMPLYLRVHPELEEQVENQTLVNEPNIDSQAMTKTSTICPGI